MNRSNNNANGWFFRRSKSVLMLVMYVSLFLQSSIPHGKSIGYFFAAILLLLCFIDSRGELTLELGWMSIYIALICCYCYFSSLWAESPFLAKSKGKDMIVIFGFTTIVCIALNDEDNSIGSVLDLIMWIGYSISIYILYFYGPSEIIGIIGSDRRIGIEVMNQNTIGMMCSFSILINIYNILNEHRIKWYSVLSIGALLCLLAAGSKKSIIILFGGIFLLLFLKKAPDTDALKRIGKMLLIILLVLAFIYAMLNLPAFSTLKTRLTYTINYLTDDGETDYSTQARATLMRIGMDLFESHPVLGIGMDNARLHGNLSPTDKNYYLHNNFIELLADGGIIGFILYYSMYAYLVFQYLIHRRLDDYEYVICFTLLIIRILLDYALVSYYSRYTYLFLVAFYSKIIRIKQEEKKNNCIRHKNPKMQKNYKYIIV